MDFTPKSIERVLQKKLTAYKPSAQFPVPFKLVPPRSFPAAARAAIAAMPAISSWADVATLPESQRADFWLLREWLSANVQYFAGAYILFQQRYGSNQIKLAGQPRTVPPNFQTRQYRIYNFGSTKLSSDIDINIEGPAASFVIAVLEDAWIACTGRPCSVWDVEYYGDFLTLQGAAGAAKTYLNSRQFDAVVGDIMPYAGVSLLRNGVALDAPEVRSFLTEHSLLNTPDWAARATDLYTTVHGMSYDEQRELYYTELAAAERLRDMPAPGGKQQERHARVFLELCKANMYRSENYILPSTVIHVVRDMQAGTEPPDNTGCIAFAVRYASCALGRATYLMSALEQLGYMLRFRDDPAKVAKYRARYDDAVLKSGDERATTPRLETPPATMGPANNASPLPQFTDAPPSFGGKRSGRLRMTRRRLRRNRRHSRAKSHRRTR